MNERVKKLWIEALESGKYEQTTGYLRRNGRFCCLGVLCNLHAIEHPEIAKTQKVASEYLGMTGDLPEAVRDWAGVDYEGSYEHGSLIADNDSHGDDFKTIAKTIRKHF